MQESRASLKMQIQNPGGLRLRTIMLIVVCTPVIVYGAVMSVLLLGAREQFRDDYADALLAQSLAATTRETESGLQPARRGLRLLRDAVATGTLHTPGPEAVPLLRSLVAAGPPVAGIRLVYPGDAWMEMLADMDGGIRARWKVRGGAAAQARRYTDAGGETVEEATPVALAAWTEADWYIGAIDALQGRSDQNLTGSPDLHWSIPDADFLTASVAVPGDHGAPVVIAIDLSLTHLDRRLARLGGDNGSESGVFTKDGTLLCASRAADTTAVTALSAAHARWVDDPQLTDARFAAAQGTGHARFTALALTDTIALHLGTLLPPDAATAPLYPLRDGIVVLTAGMLGLGALLALLTAWALARPIHAFVQQALRLDPFRVGSSPWPQTRVREFNALTAGFDLLAREARDLQHAARTPTAKPAPAPAAIPDAPEEPAAKADAPETVGTAPPEVDGSAPAPETTARQEDPAPSPMFLQALQSARKGVRMAKENNEALLRDLAAMQEQMDARESDLAELLDLLHATHTQHDAALDRVVAAHKGIAVSLWVGPAEDTTLHRRLRAGAGATPGTDTLTSHTAPFFFSALQEDPVLAVANAQDDPRVREVASKHTQAFLAIQLEAGIIVVEDMQSVRRWRPEEILFFHALAGELLRSPVPDTETTPVIPTGELEEFERPFTEAPFTPFPDADGERYRRLIDSAGMVFFATDGKGRVSYANPNAESALDGVAEHWLGRPLKEILPGDAAAFEHALHDTIHGTVLSVVEGNKGTGGRWRFAFAPLYDEDGEPQGATVCGVMLPPAAATEATPVHTQSEADRIAALPGAVLWSVDTIGCLTFVAPSVESLYGYTPRELKGRPLTALSGEEQGQHDLDQLSRLMDGLPCRGYATLHRRKDGALIDVLVYGALLHDAEGHVQGAAGVVVPAPGDAANE